MLTTVAYWEIGGPTSFQNNRLDKSLCMFLFLIDIHSRATESEIVDCEIGEVHEFIKRLTQAHL